MININVADLGRSIAFYEKLGFKEILTMDVTDPSVGATYGVSDFKLARLVWMRLTTAKSHKWPVLDLVQFIDPPILEESPVDPRRRRGPSRISFRVESIDAVKDFYDQLQTKDIAVVVPLTLRNDPGGRPLALFWLQDPDGTVIEVLHVAAK
jgi:catechol 2,3-dioxygenase-like lactoylglutathione lyase family enzyme